MCIRDRHKDDLVFTYEGRPLKKFASQGQRKSFLLGIKLAQYEFLRRRLGIKPILLLDDIFDKLDPSRIDKLLKLLNDDNFGQVFLSDTHEDRLQSMLVNYQMEHTNFIIKENEILHGAK